MKKYYAVYIFLMVSVFCIGSSFGRRQIDFLKLFPVFLFVVVLTMAGCQDIKSMKIADKWSIIIAGIAVFSCVTLPELTLASRVIGLLCVSVPFLVIALVVPGSFGGGDIKLMAVSGLFLGWKVTLVSAVIGIFIGGIWTGCMLIMRRIDRKACFPLGPFLCLGMVLGIYVGNPLAEWFIKL